MWPNEFVRRFKSVFAGLALSALLACDQIEFIPKPVPQRPGVIPEVTNVLLDLVNRQERFEIDPKDFESTSLKTLITLGTPAGFRLKLRYLELGVPLVEALKTSRDKAMLDRLFELAQWSGNLKVRAEALVTLGTFSDPKDLTYFERALPDKEVGLRLAAVEGLQKWGRPEAVPLLKSALNDSWLPLLRVFAAQALLSLGDESGLAVLYEELDNRSWIIRAMAARYLGDYGKDTDINMMLSRFQSETQNDFVIAELAIAILKLLSQKQQEVVYSAFKKGWKDDKEAAYTVAEDNVIEMDPLVIIPPRLYIPESVRVAETLNNKLLFLIKNRVDQPLDPIDANDPNLESLFKMLTPVGFALQTRYSELSILLVEGLGGTPNDLLRSELIQFAERDRNPLVRASALLALGYRSEERDLITIREGLNDTDPIVRFGAMEAVLVGRYQGALPSVSLIASEDPIPAFRLFAMRILASFGDRTGRDSFRVNIDNPDWPARAMAYWYLGRYGNEDDYRLVLSRIGTERNPFVQAEIALAASRLSPL